MERYTNIDGMNTRLTRKANWKDLLVTTCICSNSFSPYHYDITNKKIKMLLPVLRTWSCTTPYHYYYYYLLLLVHVIPPLSHDFYIIQAERYKSER